MQGNIIILIACFNCVILSQIKSYIDVIISETVFGCTILYYMKTIITVDRETQRKEMLDKQLSVAFRLLKTDNTLHALINIFYQHYNVLGKHQQHYLQLKYNNNNNEHACIQIFIAFILFKMLNKFRIFMQHNAVTFSLLCKKITNLRAASRHPLWIIFI